MRNIFGDFALLILICLTSAHVSAMYIGPLTVELEPEEAFLVRNIKNVSDKPKVYVINASRISNPKKNSVEQPIKDGELLFTPKQFVLLPNGSANIKLYYKGPVDAQERYYRVTFTESPVAQASSPLKTSMSSAALDLNISLQSVLVVRPRKVKMDYQIDLALGRITNIGNTYFEFMVKDGCTQPDDMADSKFILPGETYFNEKLKGDINQKFIVYQEKFIPVGKACW